MKVLIDTNILIDALNGREPYFQYADKILRLCALKKIEGYIAAHSIPNIFYILRKSMSDSELRQVIINLCKIVKVEGIDEGKIISSLYKNDFKDFEDCLQCECAIAVNADYIITRNIKDFQSSSILCITSEEFCNKIIS